MAAGSQADPLPTGRFAPSPTGKLHAGSLMAAVASCLDARHRGGLWYLRIDDLDTPRHQPGAQESILRTLEAHGLLWDGEVDYQSRHTDTYQAALADLEAQERLFYCTCSRRALKGTATYPGTCRPHKTHRSDAAIRVRADDVSLSFEDAIQGPIHSNLAQDIGDFIVRRRDGQIAYALATAVDDGSPTITHVVRGSDLLPMSAPQIYLMNILGLPAPAYAHIPVLVHDDGPKLSKQTHAPPVDGTSPRENLLTVLRLLGQEIDAVSDTADPVQMIAIATRAWNIDRVPRVTALTRSGTTPDNPLLF